MIGGERQMNEQNMPLKTLFISACMSMGFMISPMSLVILGNSVGLMGHLLLWTLPLIAIINLWTAHLYSRLFHSGGSHWVLTTLQLASLVPFCIGASTLILAMAGYVLNEIFFYWFPNLLFSNNFSRIHHCR
jgi:hypothetical protein